MKINQKDYDGITLLELHGDLTRHEAEQLKNSLDDLLDQSHHYVILDMEHVQFIDSQAIILILRMNREFLASGGGIKLLRPHKVVKKFLNIGQVFELFEKFESRVEAIRSFDENIKRSENLKKQANPLEEAARKQRQVLLRLLEILIEKEYLTFEEYNQEVNKSTQLVLELFRKELNL